MPLVTTKKTGDLGERIAAQFLIKRGYTIVERNYWRKWGELDLVAQRNGHIHFIEVKSATYKTKAELEYSVTHETWHPEEQVHQFKLHQISKALETWISDNNYDGTWQIDVMAVRIVPRETLATVKYLENVNVE